MLEAEQKKGRCEQRPKSREETPKEGCNTGEACATRMNLCCVAQFVNPFLLRRIIFTVLNGRWLTAEA